jgi:hypothetical protein
VNAEHDKSEAAAHERQEKGVFGECLAGSAPEALTCGGHDIPQAERAKVRSFQF